MAAKVIHFKKNGSSAPQKFVADDGGNNILAILSSPRGAGTIFLPFYRRRAAREQYFCVLSSPCSAETIFLCFIVAVRRGNNIFAVLSSPCSAGTIFLLFYRHRAAREQYFRRFSACSAPQIHSRTVLAFAGQLRAFRNVARTARGWRQASCRGENEKQSFEIEWLLFVLRYLAESNCSTRFCRPLPNRSAKVPLFFVVAKIGQIINLTKYIAYFFDFFLHFSYNPQPAQW